MITPAHGVSHLPRSLAPPIRQTKRLRPMDFMRPSFLEPQLGISAEDLSAGHALYQLLLEEFPGLPHYAGCIANLGLGRTPTSTMIQKARHESQANDEANLELLKRALQEPQIAPTIIRSYLTFQLHQDPHRTSGA